MSQIKELMEAYFVELEKYSQDLYGTHPIIPFADEDKAFHMSDPDQGDYVCWHPRKFIKQETGLSFELKEELNDYHESWLFLRMAGDLNDTYLSSLPNPFEESTIALINLHFHNGQYFFLIAKCFLSVV